MLSRRSILTGLAAMALVPGAASAAPIGVRGNRALIGALADMHGVMEGAGPVLNVIVSPACARAREMWEVTRGLSMALTVRWLPCGFTDDEVSAVAACLAGGTPESVRRLLLEEGPDAVAGGADLAAAAAQGAIYDGQVAKLLWEATGRTPAMPTMVAEMRGGTARVIRGAIPADRAADVLDLFY